MFNILWICLGIFDHFDKSVDHLKQLKTKHLFVNCLLISSLGLTTLFLSQMIYDGVGAPHTILFQIISYYIYSYMFLSIVLTGVSFFHQKTNMLKFVSLYLLMDFPLLATLPFSLISYAFPIAKLTVGAILFILGLISFILKIKVFINYFKISLSHVLVLYSLPFVLLMIFITTASISIFNKIVTFF